jgi:glutathionylspermidine synthase
MKRIDIQSRPDWQKKVEAQGFVFHSSENKYWDESACYAFGTSEVLLIEAATNELYNLCLEAVQHVIDKKLYTAFHIPPAFVGLIEYTWNQDTPSLYGRFDLAYDGSQVKMLEFNADTPTSLLEASVIQWFWLQDFDKNKDQFNSLHEGLVAYLKVLKSELPTPEMHFCCVQDSEEDYMTTAYLMDCASQAGFTTKFLYVDDIAFDESTQAFRGVENEGIHTIFKLYPYEWMIAEEFGKHLISTRQQTHWIEPAWKMILSNKMILRVLWEMFPNHPNLLRTELMPLSSGSYVRKPLLSREGSNIQIRQYGNLKAETEGNYGAEGYVYQEYFRIPPFSGNTPVLGSWVIGGEASGMGIRETTGLITDNLSRFVPHYFV